MSTPPPRHLRAHLIGVLVVMAVAVGACWDRGMGPPLPDLSQASSELEQTSVLLARIDELMSSQLDELESLRRAFFAPADGLYAADFPMDVYKHTAVSCLNAPIVEAAERPPELAQVADEVGVDCAVAPLPALVDALPPSSPRRQPALERLQTLDRLRRVRAELEDRLRRLPRILRRTRNDIATRRAELRQMESDLRRKRAEYDPERFEEAHARLDALRERIEALAEVVDALEHARPGWSRRLSEALDRTYRDLALL